MGHGVHVGVERILETSDLFGEKESYEVEPEQAAERFNIHSWFIAVIDEILIDHTYWVESKRFHITPAKVVRAFYLSSVDICLNGLSTHSTFCMPHLLCILVNTNGL